MFHQDAQPGIPGDFAKISECVPIIKEFGFRIIAELEERFPGRLRPFTPQFAAGVVSEQGGDTAECDPAAVQGGGEIGGEVGQPGKVRQVGGLLFRTAQLPVYDIVPDRAAIRGIPPVVEKLLPEPFPRGCLEKPRRDYLVSVDIGCRHKDSRRMYCHYFPHIIQSYGLFLFLDLPRRP